MASGLRLVVRIGSAGFAGAGYWSRTLRPLGIPLPVLLEEGDHAGRPYLLLERLPGTDLGAVYTALSSEQKRTIAARIADIQARVGSLGEGQGFGYVPHREGPFLHRTWPDVLSASLARSRARLAAARAFDPALVARTGRALEAHSDYFAAVRPSPFLDDTTTKNVIVDAGRLTGIVDVDWVCYGDPLLPVALTRTALLSEERSTDYIDFWCEHFDLDAARRAALRLYTAVFCLDFLSEMGHRFNRSGEVPVDMTHGAHLVGLLERELAAR